MRIAINTLGVLPAGIGGIQTYVERLIRHLAEIDRRNEYVVFVAPWNKELFAVGEENFTLVECRVPWRPQILRVVYEQLILPVRVRRVKADLFHAPANVLPLRVPCVSVVTIHDVTPFVSARSIPFAFRVYWKVMFRLSAMFARLVIADSAASKSQMLRVLKVGKEKVRAVHLGDGQELSGVELKQFPGDCIDRVSNDPYILWVGKMYYYKNLVRLLRAFDVLKRKYEPPHKLVLCGMRGWAYEGVRRALDESGLDESVVLLGYVSLQDLKWLYSNASLFAFPSVAEGFGLPILEAMSCGVPVLTSNFGAMAEIAGRAAVLVDPFDIGRMAGAMNSILTDEPLRKSLISRGLRRAEEFPWRSTAVETLEVYRQAVLKG